MRILQVIPYFYPAHAFGGPVKYAYQISQELANRDHEIVVYTSDLKDLHSRLPRKDQQQVDTYQVHYFHTSPILLAKRLRLIITPKLPLALNKWISTFSLIHLHEYRTFQNIVTSLYATKREIPYILQAHGSLPRIMDKQFIKKVYDKYFGNRLLNSLSGAIALTRLEFNQYINRGVPSEKVSIVPNGIDLKEYETLPPQGTFKTRYNLHKKRVILYLGRIHKIKGLDILVKAYAAYNCTEKDDTILVIAGPDDGYLFELRRLIQTLSLQDRVVITGPLYDQEKHEAFVDADLFILPSIYETFPSSVLEASACSLPIIASSVGSIPDIISDSQTGLLFPSGDVQQLSDKMKKILSNPTLATQLGKNARKRVEALFSIEKIVDSLESVYERVGAS